LEANRSIGQQRDGRRGIWRQRGLRFAAGANVCVSVLLAGVLAFMVNYLAFRHYARWDLNRNSYYRLSGKTLNLLRGNRGHVDVVVFFRKSHALFEDVRNLLKEYVAAAERSQGLTVEVVLVDPDRELSRTREMAQKYDVHQANVVVFECQGRRKYVEADRLANYEYSLSGSRAVKTLTGFAGEEAFSCAIQSVVQGVRPTVYFLTGHGERSIAEYARGAGYSSLARIMRRDNMVVRTLLLGETVRVPEDCSALVVAGPDRRIARGEADAIAAYLARNGRLLLLVDPATTTGLEDLMEEWGVRPGAGVVVGLTLSGRELIVPRYGDHPITHSLENVSTMFYMPRSLEVVGSGEPDDAAQADRACVTVLAANTPEGWEEMDLRQTPPRFDEDVDRRGPVPVAVAVEKGVVSGIEVEIQPTRMVVVGDSYFVSNGALEGGIGGNIDFFLSALNWLLEREALMGISPKPPGILRLDMDRRRMRSAFGIIVAGVPALAALAGLGVWLRRRV